LTLLLQSWRPWYRHSCLSSWEFESRAWFIGVMTSYQMSHWRYQVFEMFFLKFPQKMFL
jgi:hypothetical protein